MRTVPLKMASTYILCIHIMHTLGLQHNFIYLFVKPVFLVCLFHPYIVLVDLIPTSTALPDWSCGKRKTGLDNHWRIIHMHKTGTLQDMVPHKGHRKGKLCTGKICFFLIYFLLYNQLIYIEHSTTCDSRTNLIHVFLSYNTSICFILCCVCFCPFPHEWFLEFGTRGVACNLVCYLTRFM